MGGGVKAFGKRYASLVGQGIIQESVAYGMSEALAVDSRFHKSGKRGFFRAPATRSRRRSPRAAPTVRASPRRRSSPVT